MPLSAKPVSPSYQASDLVGLTGRYMAALTESALPIAELVSGAAMAPISVSSVNPTISSIAFGTAGSPSANCLTFSAAAVTKAMLAAGRGFATDPNISGQARLKHCWVAFRQTTASGIDQCLIDPSGTVDFAVGISGSSPQIFIKGGEAGRNYTLPGLATTVNHDYLLYVAYSFDGNEAGTNNCLMYYALYDFTTAAWVAATVATQVGTSNLYKITKNAGDVAGQFVVSGSYPLDCSLGGWFQGGAIFNGSIYAAWVGESNNQADVWGQPQLDAIIADPERAARGVATPSMAVSPTTAATGGGNVTYTVTGTNTSWTGGTTYSITGLAGASIVSQSIAGQVGTVVVNVGPLAGTITVHDSTDSAVATITVTLGLPGTVTGLGAVAGNTTVALSWTAPSTGGTPSGYDVFQGTTPGGESGTPVAGLTFSGTTTTVTGLTNGTAYYFKVKAKNGAGSGPASNEASATPTAAATTFTLVPPSPASGFPGVASGLFTVTPNAAFTGTITVTPSGGGLSTPIVLTFSGSAAPQTFAITPTVAGTVTLVATNSGGLTNPANATYTVNVVATGYTFALGASTGASGQAVTIGYQTVPTGSVPSTPIVVTPHSTGVIGTFGAATVTLSDGTVQADTFTPTSPNTGVANLTATHTGGGFATEPSSQNYTVTAAITANFADTFSFPGYASLSDLQAQFYTASWVASGPVVTTGFSNRTLGLYGFSATVTPGTVGFVEYTSPANPAVKWSSPVNVPAAATTSTNTTPLASGTVAVGSSLRSFNVTLSTSTLLSQTNIYKGRRVYISAGGAFSFMSDPCIAYSVVAGIAVFTFAADQGLFPASGDTLEVI